MIQAIRQMIYNFTYQRWNYDHKSHHNVHRIDSYFTINNNPYCEHISIQSSGELEQDKILYSWGL